MYTSCPRLIFLSPCLLHTFTQHSLWYRISHGAAKDGISEKTYQEIQTATTEIMSSLIKILTGALSDTKYLRTPVLMGS